MADDMIPYHKAPEVFGQLLDALKIQRPPDPAVVFEWRQRRMQQIMAVPPPIIKKPAPEPEQIPSTSGQVSGLAIPGG